MVNCMAQATHSHLLSHRTTRTRLGRVCGNQSCQLKIHEKGFLVGKIICRLVLCSLPCCISTGYTWPILDTLNLFPIFQ